MNFISRDYDLTDQSYCVVIGEIGVNHNKDPQMLTELIEKGVSAGLDVIKFQRFNSEGEISKFAALAEYQQSGVDSSSQLEMAKGLELTDEMLVGAFELCEKLGVGFLCTGFDVGSVDFIADTLGCKSVKVPSPDITNKPLIKHMARKFESLLVSTGASTMAECATVVDWIEDCGDREISLMHCVSEYPVPVDQLNMTVIKSLQAAMKLPVGYSDHSEGRLAAIMAVSFGATTIEKHYTLDRDLPGPDHKASLDIGELTNFVKTVRKTNAALGSGLKVPAAIEAKNIPLIRKSVTCNAFMAAGHVLRFEDLGIKRPEVEGAVAPADIEKIVGRKLGEDKEHDEPILWTDL